MVTRFSPAARTIVTAAEAHARSAGFRTIEAEHLMMSIATHPGPAQRVLAAVGLDPAALTQALAEEHRGSLAAVGVTVSLDGLPPATPDRTRRISFGSSARLTLERALRSAEPAGRIEPAHLLLGVLATEIGTVPRSLRRAGVDQPDLIERTRASLAAEAG